MPPVGARAPLIHRGSLFVFRTTNHVPRTTMIGVGEGQPFPTPIRVVGGVPRFPAFAMTKINASAFVANRLTVRRHAPQTKASNRGIRPLVCGHERCTHSVEAFMRPTRNPYRHRHALFAAGFCAIAVAMAGGCAQTPGVARLGPDSYTMTTHRALLAGGTSEARQAAIASAREYCAKLGKEAVISKMDETPTGHGADSVNIEFKCSVKGGR